MTDYKTEISSLFDMEDIDRSIQYTLEDIEAIYDIKERRMFLNDEINIDTVNALTYWIMLLNREDNKRGLKPEDRKPIIIYICSVGGYEADGFSLMDVIMNSVTPIYTVNMGYCYSMAFYIFLAGKKRFALKHATFLMHDGSTLVSDSLAKCRDTLEFQDVKERALKKFVLEHSNITEEIYNDKYRKEWYTMSDEAKKYGLVDYIVGDDVGFSEVL